MAEPMYTMKHSDEFVSQWRHTQIELTLMDMDTALHNIETQQRGEFQVVKDEAFFKEQVKTILNGMSFIGRLIEDVSR
jgi:hypothetical protein